MYYLNFIRIGSKRFHLFSYQTHPLFNHLGNVRTLLVTCVSIYGSGILPFSS